MLGMNLSSSSPNGSVNLFTPLRAPIPHSTSLSPRSSGSGKEERSTRQEDSSLLARLKPAVLELVLENSGSVARDHLALERTFLAYTRTSSVIATAGIALVQLFTVASSTGTNSTFRRLDQFARPLGATMVSFGLLVLVLGSHRYFVVQASLLQGSFPVSRFGVMGITSILFAIAAILFTVLVSG